MKILQLCTKVPFPPKDGGAMGVFAFSKALSLLGHKVYILAVNPPKHFSQNTTDFNTDNISISDVKFNTSPNPGSIIKNLVFSKLPYQADRFRNRSFEDTLKNILIEKTPDIVQIEGIYLSTYIPVIRKFSNAPIILRSHNIEHQLWLEIKNEEKNILKRLYFKWNTLRLKKFELEKLLEYDGIITFTQNDKEYIRKNIKKQKLEIIPFGFYESRVKTNIQINKTIGYIGALDWLPNINALKWFILNVWPHIYSEIPDSTLYIAGRNAPRWLEKLFINTDGIKYLGEIEDSEELFKLCNIVVVPLFSGSGVRIKILEAMYQGKIVVASAKAIRGIPVTDGIEYIQANTKEEYINKIKDLFAYKPQYENIINNAHALISINYDIIENTQKLIRFYEEIKNA